MEENNKTNNESRKWLYDKFVAKGINVGKDYDEFDSLLTNNNESRKWAYDKACSLGYNVGKDYDEFNSIIGADITNPTESISTESETEQTEQPVSTKPADPVEYVKQDSPSVAVDEDTDVKVQSSQRTMQPETTEDLIARIQRNGKKDKQEELLEALSQRQEQKTAHDRYVKEIEDSIEKKANELIEEDVNLSTFNKTKDNGLQFNPSTGKLERSYSTPYGNTTTDRHLADMESFQYASNMTVSGQLRQAQRKLNELEKEKSRRSKEVHEEATEFNNSKLTPLGRAFAGPDIYVAMQTSDPEKEALDVAIQETKDKIERLQREINRQGGKRVGYFRGIGTFEMSDLDMGFGELRRSMTLMNADKLVDGNATEGERKAYDHMMKAIYENEQSKQEYPDGWWFNMGVMTKDMVPFMIDIALFKGATSMPSVFAKGSTKVATKVIGKEVVEEMAKQGFKSYVKKNGVKGFTQYAADWGIKTLGVTADNMLISAPLMVNTVQGAKTASDIIDRKLGSVVVNEDGTYDFSNDQTWSYAIWQGEANAIIEAGVEMSTSKVLSLDNMSKLAEVIGAKRISGVLARTDASALGAMMSKTDDIFNKMGISDIFGEVGEEYKGQFYRTILNLDDAYIQNSDGSRTNLLATWDFHKDVWGGTALAMGSMSVVRHGATAANYTRHKHNVNKADNRAGEILGRDVWEPIRIIIDQSTNEDMGDVMKSIIQDREFTDEEVFAVLDYAERNMILRGFNLATLAQSRNAEETDSDIIAQQNNESFLDGYNASTPQEMNDANNNYLYHRENMVRTFGLTDESDIDAFLGDNPIETVARRRQAGASTEETQTIIDYINAKATYDGMLQSVRDDIDGRIEQSNARIDSYVNRSTGNIHGAVLKQDDRLVYIVNGNAVAFDDGVIDTRNSSNTIIVKDAETGELKQISPSDLLTLYDVQDPNEQKEISAQQIRNGVADESLNKINGVVDFNDKAQFLNEAANQIAITMILAQRGLDADYIKTFLGNAQIVENPDGTLTFTDGQNEVVVPKQEIQQQVDANNMQRVADFNNQVNGTRRTRNSNVALSYLLNKGKGGIENIGLFLHAIADAFPNVSNEIEDIHNGIDDKFIGMDPAEFIAYDFYEIKQIRQIVYNAYGKEGIDIFDELLKNASGFIPSEGLKMENRINSLKSLTDSSTDEMPETAPENPQEGLVQQGMNNTSSTEEKVSQTPQFSLIPKDVSGNPIYEQADSETAWDALMEDAEGDEMMAGEVAKSMIADKEAELKKLEKSKIKEGKTPAEKMAALKERKAEVEKIKQDIEAWKKIAAVPMQRQIAQQERIRQEEAEAAAKRKADEERLLAERKEAERKEQELLNGIPDYSEDTPQNARARGYRRVNGHIEERQQPIEAVQGKETEVEFSNDVRPKGHYAVIDASQLQPSHIQGNRNPLHFLDEAQPKERNDKASIVSAQKIAGNIRPATITTGETAYVGTPTVNTRGEVIQGNSRSDALKLMYGSHNDQAQTYKQYLINNAEQFGLNPEDVSNMESPVLVRMLDVSDEQAITLGQYVAQDTESGGVERIKPKNAVKKMGDDINSFANMLLDSADEDTSFAELLDQNGVKVLKWMAQKGYITDTQYSSAFDTKGSLTAEAKNDLRGIMYQSIFEGGNTRLEEMFNALPAKAQKAILATAHRDFNSPNSERMIEEIQNSIRAFYALMQDEQFAKAKNFKDATKAVEAWQKQYQMDDVTGEGYLPSEKFSNFALHLAKMYKGEKQSNIQGVFAELYDLIQGTKEDNLFEQADNTPRTLVQAIKETLNIDYNGQRRNNVLGGDNKTSQQGQHGRTGDVASRERTESGEQSADSSGRTEGDSGKRRTTETHSVSEEDKIKLSDPRTMSDEEKQRRGDMLRNAPTVEVQKNAITSTPELSARKAAEKWWDDNVHEPVLYNTEAGEVEINRNSIESSLAHRYGQKKLDAITSLIEGFENAVYLGTMEDGTRQEGVLNHYFAYPIMYNGELNYVFCRAMQDANKNRLYVHEVFLADKIKKGDTLQTAAFQPHGGISLYRDILANILDYNSDKDTTNSPKVKGLEEKVSENNENNSDAIIDKARLGDKDAIETLNSYGIDWQTSTVYRHVAQSEVDALQRGETINGRFDDGRVDVTSSKDVTTASSSDYRVTFKDTFDFGKNKNVRMKNAELGDGWTERGYTLSDVAKIEKRNDDGTYTTIYDANTSTSLNEQIESAEKEVNTSPTDKQKEAGNYKKGHVQIGTFNITIEQPKGSVRSGVDANGRKWETTMHNTYGYIRGTEGVDGDHIDVFLSDDIDGWNGNNVFVVDQYNEDGTFDEHKVMLGFNTIEEAESAYLDNYEKGWEKKHKIVVSPIHTENFEKWIESSHRKTKPFAEYKNVQTAENRTKNNENRTKSTENDSKVEESSVKDESKNKTIVEQSKKPSSKIEDFGEKIGGARKDVIRKYADKINVNGTTFGSMFPKPDIDKLIEAGLPIDRVAALKSVYDNAKHDFERSKKHRGKERALRETVFYAVFAKGILSGNEDFELHHEGLVFTEVGVKLVKANIALYQAVFDRLGVEYIKTDLSAYAITPLTEETKKKLNLKSLNEHNGKMQESLAKRKGTEPPVYKDGDLINFIGEKYYNPKDQFETLEEAIDTMVERIGKEVKVGEEIKHTPILYWNVDALGRKDYSKIFIGIKVHGHGIVKLMEFKSSNEANSWIDEHDADFQQMAAAKIEQLKSDKSKPLPKYRIDNIYVRDNSGSIVRYDVYADFGKGIMRPLKSFDIPAKETSQERLRAQSEVYKNEVLPYMNSEEAKQSADEHARRIQHEKESKNRNYTTERKSRERVGRDWRNGKDATPDMFVDMDGNKSVFGFRAVEFGNYVTNKERQQFLNDIYDALMDMSDVLGVSPRALSLGGQLAIAVGARGKSSASGHYEPEKNVINLTKTSGYGILAHEWLHAFDRYFSNYNPSAIYVGGVQYATSEEYKDDMRQEVKDAFAALMDVIKKSDYYKRSMMLGEYWSSDKELAARALQDHIIRKLNERGQKNEFLSNLTATEDWDGEAENYPFPLGEESERIGEAIDNLFSVIDEKVDEKGNTVMYQKGELVMDAESEAFRRATERTMKQLESIGIDVEIVEDGTIVEKFENRAISPNFSRSAGIFYSNAKKAVLDIKQDKATPEQWLKMIENNGGLKASEDRWLGLSDWLKTQQKRKNIDVQYAKEYDGEAKQIAHGIKEGDISSIDLAAVEMVKLVKDGDILIPIPSRTGKATTSLALANRIAELAGKGKVADVLTGKERESLYNIKKEGKELPKASELEFVLKNQDVLNGNNRVVFVDNVMGTGTTLEAAVELIPNATALVYAKDNSTLSDKKTLTKDEILNFINENSIQIEEVHYSQFGEGLIDEATRMLDAELKGIGWDAMLEKYPGFDELFELFDGELVWSENRASIGEYEDFIIDNKITDVNPSDNAINETREGYTTSGLKGNREIALTVPGIESYNSHDAVHFGDAGDGRAVAWVRFGETTDSDGKRVLVIDEIQSKRHQDGREKGYRDDKTLTARLDALKESAAKAGMTFNADVRNRSLQFFDLEGKPIGTITRKPTDEQSEIMAQVRNVLFYNDGVPSAPFEKNWQELAMKRMLRYAAENGFDKVAWTTGEQQAERYSLSKAVKKTTVSVMSDNTRMVTLDFRHDEGYMDFKQMRVDEKGTIIGGDFTGSQLSDIVGKEFAIKIMGVEAERETFTDNDLRIGGEGMKGFYDKILPSFVSKYTKKWGGKVEETELPETGLSMHSVDVTPQMKEDVMKGQPMFHKGQMSFDFLNQQDTPLSDTRLRKLEEGETSKIERIFTENKNFDFTSGEKIESIDDVAFIFKQLEDESIENSFAVLVKDGKPTVIHLGMGSYTATGLNGSALNVAVERIQPDKIYFIHNHPSGNLTASRQDIELLNRLKSTYGDIFEDGIIINLRSGKFATFNAEEKNIHDEKNIDNAVPVKVYSFNKQVFEKNYDPAETFKIRSSSDVAKFISSHRLGERPKLGILVCNNQLGVVGNVFTPYTKVTKENAKDIAKDIVYYTTSMGGTCAMMFGNANIYEVGSKRISQHVEDISTGSIKLMDYLNMQKDGSYWSASDEGVSFMRTSSGTIYGWTVDGKVYLTKDGINPNTPVHEYSHLWAEALMKNDPVLWSRIVNGLKDTPVWNEVMLDEEYSSIHHNDNLVASEVLSRLSGTENYRRTMEEAQREIESEKGIFAKAEKITIWERVKQALKDFWNWVVKTYGTNNITPEEAVNMTLNDFWNGIRPDVNDNPMQRMFVGEKGAANIDKAEEATARLDNLSVARKMEAEGKDAKNIKLATGWERGSDGKWRYEVMDNFRFDKSGNVDFEKRNPEYRRYKELIRKNNSLAFEGKELSAEESAEFDKLSATWKGTKLHNSRRLKDYIDAPELFEAYPELKDVDVKFAVLEDGVQGKYNHKQKTVTLNAMLGKEAAASTLNHEIQHAIQHIEGFAKGGNSNDVITRKQEFKSEVRNLHEMMLDTPEWAEYVRLVDRWIDNEDASVEARIEAISNSGVLDGIRSEQDRLRRKYGNNTIVGRILNGPYAEDADIWNELPESFNDRFDAYLRLAGEVESRNVQRRMEMNEEERRSSLAQETEDVAREDQVFLHGALENAEEDDVLYRDDEYKTEKIFGGIWIEDKQEFAKFVSAVNNNYVFEEDGKGIAYTDNHFYAYYWNIDGEPIPYIDVYLNAEESQEVVNLVNEEIKNDGKEPRVESYVNSVVRWARTRQSSNNGNNGNNNSISSSRKIDGLDRNILRKGRYFDNPSLYVKTQRADRYNRDGINSTVSSSPAPAQRRQMVEHAENLAKRLHLDNIEIVNSVSGLEGKKKSAKGFHEPKTGKITIVIPNNTSIADIEKTLLHEAVAHYGLRQLFGEHFDTFLDNVYNNADESIRKRISELAIRKYNYDFRKATEEYLASLAENTNFENAQQSSWWQKVKDFFADMLSKLGFKDFRGVTLTDNELRYVLWRSYENLKEKKNDNIFSQASDIAKQYELGVGDYAKSSESEDDVLFRDGDPEIHEKELVRDKYDRRIKAGWYQSKEAMQDSMLSLKEAMKDIAGEENIEDIDGFENAYLGENRLSSVNKAEADAFARTVFKPMLEEVAKLAPTAAERQELVDYMMAKHGLERNEYMRQQAMQNGEDADRDFAGLTALTGFDNIQDAEAEAQRMVQEFENNHDVTELWEKVNATSKAILSKSYECGLMDKDTFENISNMYEFYIPLRGFDETTSADAYAYLSHKDSIFNAPIKKTEGRKSKADDPFAYLQSMAESAIMQGNRNRLVKQRFLNFVLNHPSDLVSASELWLKYDDVSDEWKPVFPNNIGVNDSGEVVEQKIKDFEEKMKSLAKNEPDKYKKGRDAIGIPYRVVEKKDLQQHQVIVKRNGRDVVLTINGNPRLAQALNGLTNPDNDMSGAIGAILRSGEWVNRQLSALYTTRNPDFVVSNFIRDMLYSNSMAWIKESPNYALRFHRNYMRANPITMKRLLNKHRKGTLDMNDNVEKMFCQFMMNGGETGYANIRDIERHKNDIRKELKMSNGRINIRRAWSLLAERFDELNRAIENCARFAAFMTSKEMGRTTDRAIYDAKEISVNFNKKGSGSKFYGEVGQRVAGNASALVSGFGRSGFVFWNAAIQGSTNFGRQVKRHPVKAFTSMAAMFIFGALMAYLGMDDDDDDNKNSYYNLPEYVRRSNILFRAGEHWISIPLPVEYRAIYGLGELMTSTFSGKEHLSDSELAEAIIGQMSQVLPLDFMEGEGGLNALIPSAVKPVIEAYVTEKSWTGMPLYKDTPYNKNYPEWTKAYKSANKHIVGLAQALNEATGGDRYTKGNVDINPAKIEYMLKGYFSGYFNTVDKITKMVETATGEREYDPQNFLLLNRVVKAGDERTEYRAVNNEYQRLKNEYEILNQRLKNYEKDTDNGIFDYAEKIDFIYNSPEFQRLEIFEMYKKDIKSAEEWVKQAASEHDDKEVREAESYLNELKKEMIEEMNKTRQTRKGA